MKPRRIQRKRTKGWRMPEGAVYVGRPTKWGNPFKADGQPWDRSGAVARFRELIAGASQFRSAVRRELRGKDLVCWCPLVDEHGNRVLCHADVLLEIANR